MISHVTNGILFALSEYYCLCIFGALAKVSKYTLGIVWQGRAWVISTGRSAVSLTVSGTCKLAFVSKGNVFNTFVSQIMMRAVMMDSQH